MPRYPDAERIPPDDANRDRTPLKHRTPHTEGSKRKISRAVVAANVRTGRTTSLKHYGYAEVAIREDVADLVAVIWSMAPWLSATRDHIAVDQCARLAAQCRRLDQHLDEEHVSIAQSSLLSRTEMALQRSLDSLGLTPRSAAALGVDLSSIRARQQEASRETLAKYRPRPDPEDVEMVAEIEEGEGG